MPIFFRCALCLHLKLEICIIREASVAWIILILLHTCHPHWIDKDGIGAEMDEDHDDDLFEHFALSRFMLPYISTF